MALQGLGERKEFSCGPGNKGEIEHVGTQNKYYPYTIHIQENTIYNQQNQSRGVTFEIQKENCQLSFSPIIMFLMVLH